MDEFVFCLSMFLFARLVSSTDSLFQVSINQSSGGGLPDYGAAKAIEDCNKKLSKREVRYGCNLFFHVSMLLLTHLVYITDSLFQILTNMSSGSAAPGYSATEAPSDCNETASERESAVAAKVRHSCSFCAHILL